MKSRTPAAASARGPRERLSNADASNIHLDSPDQVNAFLMAGVLAPGGPVRSDGTVDLGELRDALGARLDAAPRMTQRIAREGRHLVWEPVTVDLARHVRQVDPVAGLEGFEALCARLIVEPIASDRPLWEALVVPNVATARVGLVLRIHHAMADGLAAVRLADALFDPVTARNDPSPSSSPHPVAAGAEPSRPRPAAADAPLGRAPKRSALATLVSGVKRTATLFRADVPRTALLGKLGPRRSIAFTDVDLSALARGADSAGATVNDALLAAVANGVRTGLRDIGETPPVSLPVSVPVALPDRGRSGNAVGVMIVPLPTEPLATTDLLRRIAGTTRERRRDARARGTLEVNRTALGAHIFARLARHQRFIAGFVTNVPGPRGRLSLAGAPLEQVWPVTALQGNVRLGVSALSYAGRLRCTIHADVAGVSARTVAAGVTEEFARVVEVGRA